MSELFASRELHFLPCFGCWKQDFVVSSRSTNIKSRICVLCWSAQIIIEGHEQCAAALSLYQESKYFCCVTSLCAQTFLTCSFQNNFPRVRSQPSAALSCRGGPKCQLEDFSEVVQGSRLLHWLAQACNCAGFHIKTAFLKFFILNTSPFIQNQGIIRKAAS